MRAQEALDGWAGRPAVSLGEVGSTQAEARRLADAGVPEGSVVRAEHQTLGRGRLGRRWLDEPGTALLVSIVLRPPVDFSRLPQLSLVAGVALAQAVREASGLAVGVEWPNDLLIRGRKVAGILAESHDSADGAVVILGIGLNVNQTRLPRELAGRATSLAAEAGHAFDREQLLRTLVDHLERWYRRWVREGFAPVREAWRGLSETLGRPVVNDRGEAGIAEDLGEDGALVVRTERGGRARWVAGDARPADAPGRAS